MSVFSYSGGGRDTVSRLIDGRARQKRSWIIGLTVLLLVTALFGVSNLLLDYQFERTVSGYLNLADDASVAGTKLEHLEDYRDAVAMHIPADGDAKYVFKTPQTSVAAQVAVLDSLIERVTSVAQLDPQSLEYQQAMLQITDQEFGWTIGKTNYLLSEAWLRGNVVRYVLSLDAVFFALLVLLVVGTVVGFESMS